MIKHAHQHPNTHALFLKYYDDFRPEMFDKVSALVVIEEDWTFKEIFPVGQFMIISCPLGVDHMELPSGSTKRHAWLDSASMETRYGGDVYVEDGQFLDAKPSDDTIMLVINWDPDSLDPPNIETSMASAYTSGIDILMWAIEKLEEGTHVQSE